MEKKWQHNVEPNKKCMRSIDETLEIQSREMMVLPPEGVLGNFMNNMTFEQSLKYGEQPFQNSLSTKITGKNSRALSEFLPSTSKSHTK